MSQLLQYYKSFQFPKQQAPAAAPTFQDLTIDDELSDLQRIVRYSKSNIALQRLVHVKLLADVANEVGFPDAENYIIPLLADLGTDTEAPIKQHLLEQLALLAKVFNAFISTSTTPADAAAHSINGRKISSRNSNADASPMTPEAIANRDAAAYRDIVEAILPVAAMLLEDETTEVRQTAVNAVVSIAECIKEDDLGQYVLTIILRLAHDDDKEEMRMTASELLNLLAERLGTDLCKQFVIPEIVSLAEDPVFRVRKAAALSFHNICKVGGEHELFERLMPAFVRLSKDDMYRVRKAVAQSLSDVSKSVSDDIRLGVLIEIFLRLAQDPSRQVKQCVLQQAGMFIATLPTRATTEAILTHFCSMSSGPTGDMTVDTELKQYCAYYFPGVLVTIGGSRWSEMREVYHTLVQCRNVNVKQTLSLSLHEIARILHEGGISVEVELLPVFEDMIQDVESVQVGVIKNIAKFLALLSPPCRASYLPLLHDFLHSASPFNWRMREHLAVQLPQLLDLPAKGSIITTLFPLIMALLQDPVASVRHASFKGVAKLLLLLDEIRLEAIKDKRSAAVAGGDENPETPGSSRLSVSAVAAAIASGESDVDEEQDPVASARDSLMRVIFSINLFVTGDVYQKRLLWIELAHVLVKELPRKLIEVFFIDGIVALTSDPVCNVRVGVSKLLAGWAPEFEMPTAEELEVGDAAEAVDCNDVSAISEESVTGSAGAAATSTAAAQNNPSSNPNPFVWLLRRRDIRECVMRLKEDDKDVQRHMILLAPLFPDVEFKAISCRGMKHAPGGAKPVAVQKPTSSSAGGRADEDDLLLLADTLSMKAASDDAVDHDELSTHSASTIESLEQVQHVLNVSTGSAGSSGEAAASSGSPSTSSGGAATASSTSSTSITAGIINASANASGGAPGSVERKKSNPAEMAFAVLGSPIDTSSMGGHRSAERRSRSDSVPAPTSPPPPQRSVPAGEDGGDSGPATASPDGAAGAGVEGARGSSAAAPGSDYWANIDEVGPIELDPNDPSLSELIGGTGLLRGGGLIDNDEDNDDADNFAAPSAEACFAAAQAAAEAMAAAKSGSAAGSSSKTTSSATSSAAASVIAASEDETADSLESPEVSFTGDGTWTAVSDDEVKQRELDAQSEPDAQSAVEQQKEEDQVADK